MVAVIANRTAHVLGVSVVIEEVSGRETMGIDMEFSPTSRPAISQMGVDCGILLGTRRLDWRLGREWNVV